MCDVREGIHLYFYGERFVQDVLLTKRQETKYWIYRYENKERLPFMEVMWEEDSWYLLANAKVSFRDGQQRQKLHDHMYVQLCAMDEKIYFISTPYHKQQQAFSCYEVVEDELYIGRDPHCDIQYKNGYVSSTHAHIWKQGQTWMIEDVNSTNGCYVNGKRIQHCCLERKDIIQILALKIIVGDQGMLMNTWDEIRISESLQPIELCTFYIKHSYVKPTMRLFTIPERYEPATFTIDSPPPLPTQKHMPLLFVIGPALTMGLSSISMGVFSLLQMSQQQSSLLQSIPTLIMAFSMGAGTLLWPLLSRRYERKENYRQCMVREDTYHQYIRDIDDKIQKECVRYAYYLNHVYHTFHTCYEALCQNQIIRYSKHHPAYQSITLGMGTKRCPLCFDYHQTGFVMQKDRLQSEVEQRCENSYMVDQVPIALDMTSLEALHIAGEQAKLYMFTLFYQLVMTHHEHDLPTICFISEEDVFAYGVLWVPHHMHQETNVRYVITNEKHLKTVFEDLLHTTSDMKYDVFFFSNALLGQWNQLKQQLTCAFCEFYIEDEIHCANEAGHAYIALKQREGVVIYEFQEMFFQYEQKAIDYLLCARQLANAKPLEVQTDKQTNSVQFLDLYRCGNVKQLQIKRRWLMSDAAKSLQVAIGKSSSNTLVYLDAHERYDGAHGLFAGMTGSGKSECLLTYILSLALNFSPYDVSFLLIDYKGGGMTKVCGALPHIAGCITNLDQDMMQRALFAMRYELVRRQQLFNSCASTYHIGNMNIDMYQQLSKEHTSLEPLSHLFIIADEFAELKTAQHEFLEELKKSARIGRSLGIHLMLATQKPAGVIDDQIWSNAHFHLCMKVQSIQDSQDMLRKDDAAYLHTTGECYLQVGLDERYQKGQIAWSGGPYIEKDAYEDGYQNELCYVDALRCIQIKKQIERHKKTKIITQMEAVMEEIVHVAKENKQKAPSLWEPPLREVIYACDHGYQNMMIDDMKNQSQFSITYEHLWQHHQIVYGMLTKDKERFITSYLYYLSSLPSFVAVYVFDFDTHIQQKFHKKKHIVDIIFEHEEAKVRHFFYQMEQEIKLRKQGEKAQPIVWILHHYEVFHELYEGYENQLSQLLREGEKYEIYILITTSSPNSISYRLTQYIAEVMVFHMYDPHDYKQLMPMQHTIVPNQHEGSGIVYYKNDVVVFQILQIQDEDIRRLANGGEKEKCYTLQVMPTHVAYVQDTTSHKLYLGKQCSSVQDVFWDLDQKGLYFIFSAYRFFKPFYTLVHKYFQACDNVFMIKKNQMTKKGKKQSEEQVLDALQSVQPAIFIWESLYACTSVNLQDYVMQDEMKQHTHILFIKMDEQMEYTRYVWYQSGVAEAICLWMGKGFEEHRYALHSPVNTKGECKANEGILWEEDTCIKLQLWEEEMNG